jgi:MFS family permease
LTSDPGALTVTRADSGWSWLLHPGFLVVIAAQFLMILTMGAVNIAAPVIQRELDASSATLLWLVAVYQLGFALVLVLGGRLGDLRGSTRMFRIGFSVFLVAGVLAALAPTSAFLLGARVLQGVGGGLTAPQVLAVIQRTFSGHRRANALGLYTTVSASAYMLGQVLTGGLLDIDPLGFGWRWAFACVVPLGVVVLLISRRTLPDDAVSVGGGVDRGGVVLLAAAAVLVLFPLIQGRPAGWPIWIFGLLALAVPALVGFVAFERSRAAHGRPALLQLDLFRLRTFAVGNALAVVLGLISFSLVVYVTITLQLGFDKSPLATAFVTAPIPFSNMFGAMSAAPMLERWGRRTFVIGPVLIAASVVLLVAVLTVGPEPLQPLHLVPGMLLLGFSLGIAIAAGIAVTLRDVPEAQAGAASGIQQTIQQLTSSVGIALFGIVFYGVLGSSTSVDAYVDALSWTLGISLVVCVVLVAGSWLLPEELHARVPVGMVAEPEDMILPVFGDGVGG